MKYEEIFKVGQYGAHAGPAARIIRIFDEYRSEAYEGGCNMEIELEKISCP